MNKLTPTVAADILAENRHMMATCLSEELHKFIEATVLLEKSPAEAFRNFGPESTEIYFIIF